jgi:hypothetical protein
MNTTNGSLKGQIGLEKNRKLHAVLQFLKWIQSITKSPLTISKGLLYKSFFID